MQQLFILRQAPYQSSLAREALDMVLATAAFDQKVQLLFLADGVFQLQHQQQAERLQQKNIEKTLQAFSLYDIDDIFYCQRSAQQRGLEDSALFSHAVAMDNDQCQQLIAAADKIISL